MVAPGEESGHFQGPPKELQALLLDNFHVPLQTLEVGTTTSFISVCNSSVSYQNPVVSSAQRAPSLHHSSCTPETFAEV